MMAILLDSLVPIFPVIPLGYSAARFRRPGYQSDRASGSGIALFLTGLILSSQRLQLTPNVISGTPLNNVAHPLRGGFDHVAAHAT
jgi:hypothetical protein